MTLQSYLTYLILVLIATATPGPAVLFIMTQSTLHGWGKAIFAALGNIIGLLSLGVVAVTGLGLLLQTSAVAFGVVKYLGAAYLIYLGIKMFTRGTFRLDDPDRGTVSRNVSRTRIFAQAFVIAVSNPKAIVFLTALFPPFIHADAPLLPQFALLIGTLMFFSFGFLMTYALLAHQAKAYLTHPNRATRFNRISGSIFVGFGLLLAGAENR